MVAEITPSMAAAGEKSKFRCVNIEGSDYECRCNIAFRDVILRVVVWIVLSILTLGIYTLVVPYVFAKFIFDRTEIVDRNRLIVGKLTYQMSSPAVVRNILAWFIIGVLTLGFGLLVAPFYIMRRILTNTRVEFF